MMAEKAITIPKVYCICIFIDIVYNVRIENSIKIKLNDPFASWAWSTKIIIF